MMKLFQIHYDGEPYFVQACNMGDAIRTWHEHIKTLWVEDYTGEEEPDSCSLIHDGVVILQKCEITEKDFKP